MMPCGTTMIQPTVTSSAAHTRRQRKSRRRSTTPSRATSSDMRRFPRPSSIASLSSSVRRSPWRARHGAGYHSNSASTRPSVVW